MTDDAGELRERIARGDPARRPAATDLIRAVTADEIRERAMQTIETAPTSETPTRRRRPALAVLGAAASVAALVVAVAAVTRDGGAPERTGGTTLTLAAPAGDAGGPTMSSCVRFDVAILREMPVAFAGTVAELASGTVTLEVDRWYKGGDADRVTVAASPGGSVALDGVEFTEGGRYLVTATDGTVNGCGFSGPASADLERAFAEAFPAG